MKNKKLLVTVLIFVLVLGVAGVLYAKLGDQLQPQGLTAVAPATTEPATQVTEPQQTEAVTQTTEAATEPQVVPAPDFTVLDWDGNEVKLSDYFGKPIVLNFWAYWCGPCQMEMPEFNTMYEELGGEVVFLMTHVDADTEAGKELVSENGYSFPVVFDATSAAAASYGVTAFPTSFFIDKEGNLQAYYVGAMSRELLQLGIDTIYTPEG